MLSDLFSSMDNNNSLIFFVPMALSFIIYNNLLWSNNKNLMLMEKVMNLMSITNLKFFFINKLLSGLFLFLILLNFYGIFPLVYSVTTNIWICTSIALILWLTFLLSGFSFSYKKFLANLAPAGSPIYLVPLLVLIETISILIRPLTLSIRLMANISAGHIILCLVSQVLSSHLSFSSNLSMYFLLTSYVLFEFFVCVVQGYIFVLLLTLYLQEHPIASIKS